MEKLFLPDGALADTEMAPWRGADRFCQTFVEGKIKMHCVLPFLVDIFHEEDKLLSLNFNYNLSLLRV